MDVLFCLILINMIVLNTEKKPGIYTPNRRSQPKPIEFKPFLKIAGKRI